MEHVDALGGSLESIAAAKAGIVKRGGVVVTARQPVPGFDRALREALDTRSPGAVMHAPVWHAVSAGTPAWEDGLGALHLRTAGDTHTRPQAQCVLGMMCFARWCTAGRCM
jgi:folylpolyglutamate synthase/dihydropteroate synthase